MPGVCQLHVERCRDSATTIHRLGAAALLAFGALAVPLSAAADSNTRATGSTTNSTFSLATPAPAGDACSIERPEETFMSVLRSSSSAGPSEAPPTTLGVTCALPFVRGFKGSDCNGSHTIRYNVTGATANAKITAELLGINPATGNVLGTLPVSNNDRVHMNSRVAMNDFKMTTKSPGVHEVFAPVPLLRVTVEDQGEKVQAFCSNIPYLQVVEPKGEVVTESAGNVTDFLAAIPLISASTLDLKVDGVHVFDATHLNIPNPGVCTVNSPCGGTIDINGTNVTIENLIVDVATDVNVFASNTLSATFKDLACGGHVFVLNGQRLAGFPRSPTSLQCHVDTPNDKGSSSIFAIDLTSPTPQGNSAVPTPVTGEVCSGRPITSIKLNGLEIGVAGASCTPGDGENSGNTCTVPINTTLSQTDLVQDITSGDTPLGTIDAGSNRLTAAAKDDLNNRTYENVIFYTGTVLAPGIDVNAAFAQAQMKNALTEELKNSILAKVQDAANLTSVEMNNAFVVGLSASGVQKLFDNLCTKPNNTVGDPNFGKTPAEIFAAKVKAELEAKNASNPLKTGNLAVDCSCNPDYKVFVTGVTVGSTVTCPLTFEDDKFHVTMNLPDVAVTVKAEGFCQDDFPPGVCIARTIIDLVQTTTISGIKLDFDVTEGNLMKTETSTPAMTLTASNTVKVSGGVDLQCIGADICEVALTVLTLGLVDFSPSIDISKTTDFSKQVGAAEPDPVKLNEIKVDEETVVDFRSKLSGEVSSVSITPQGIVAGLKGFFTTTLVDPEVENTPGASLSPAPLPTLPVPNAKEVFIGLADDTINMMLASMTTGGGLKTTCSNDSGKTVNDLLPADCNTLTGDTLLAKAFAIGACFGVKVNTSCESIAIAGDGASGINTATAQGVCHAFRGDNCNTIPVAATVLASVTEKTVCTNTPNPGLQSTQPVLFCARSDVPPRMLLEDNTSTSAVEAALRVNDLGIAMVVDKDGDGDITTPLANVPGCFANGVPTNVDCNMFSTCVDLNFNFNMAFQTCQDGKPGFKNNFTSVQILSRDPGLVCSGSTGVTSDAILVASSSSDDVVTVDLTSRSQQFAPNICGAGLTMGGFVTCDLPTLLAINTDASPALKDYLAITCDVKK